MYVPTATYRVQCNARFSFANARAVLPYLERLGISHLYMSPVFAARRDSPHGYDVIDPARLNPELGGEAAFEALTHDLRECSMGLLLDIVPNHMAAVPENPWWRDVVERGRASPYAASFDIDWEAGGGRLIDRRTGGAELNYRRFFDIDHLAGVRVEDPAVFDATHELTLRLVREGAVAGLRVDHIDGLYDPAAYLDRLRRAVGAATYLVVEKVLTGDEALPPEWPAAGTTGYDFLNTLNALFVDPAGIAALGEAYAAFTGLDQTFADTVYEQKRRIIALLFPAELRSLARQLHKLSGGALDERDLSAALVEVAACFTVYRTYARDGHISSTDRANVERAAGEARRRAGAPASALDLLRGVLLLETPDMEREAALRFVMRWQQFTGPAAAKGLEDTALYVYNRLLSANDVGADPDGPGAIDVAAFHDRNAVRLRDWPHTMNATATHDTKRGEDVRARLNVLSELPKEWSRCLRRWSELNAPHKTSVSGRLAPDANEEVLLYQTLLGAWPLDDADVQAFRERLRAYAIKAAREAKLNTSWHAPDAAYEAALAAFVDVLFSHEEFLADFRPFQREVAFRGVTNSLAQVLLKIASPGVPDFYQGTELWDLSLVDPDNRRPVDFALGARLLDGLEARAPGPALARELLESWPDGRIKLYLTARALAFRRARAALFSDGAYVPLEVSGVHRRRAVAFGRRHEGMWAVVAVPRLVARLTAPGVFPLGAVWRDTAVALPADAPSLWTDTLANETLSTQGSLPLSAAFAHLPVALLHGG